MVGAPQEEVKGNNSTSWHGLFLIFMLFMVGLPQEAFAGSSVSSLLHELGIVINAWKNVDQRGFGEGMSLSWLSLPGKGKDRVKGNNSSSWHGLLLIFLGLEYLSEKLLQRRKEIFPEIKLLLFPVGLSSLYIRRKKKKSKTKHL